MAVPAGDLELVQIMDAALADAAGRAGPWLACRPGCTQCCHGAFAINTLDAARLELGIDALRRTEPEKAGLIEERARAWIDEFGPAFPGDRTTGALGTSEEEEANFEDFANDAPCPVLNPESGLCDLYQWRPMACRVFGPPVRVGDGNQLALCELCFVGASEKVIAACEMAVPQEMEARLVSETGDRTETVVAFALMPPGRSSDPGNGDNHAQPVQAPGAERASKNSRLG